MRISDWSSDVCSSDLLADPAVAGAALQAGGDFQRRLVGQRQQALHHCGQPHAFGILGDAAGDAGGRIEGGDRKSVGEGKSESVRVYLGGRRTIKKTKS